MKNFSIIAVALLFLGCAGERYYRTSTFALERTALIDVESPGKSGFATGVFISEKGHVLTNAHLFDNDVSSVTITVVRANGMQVSMKLLHLNRDLDLALLYPATAITVPYATFANPSRIHAGQEIIYTSNVIGLEFSVFHGIISHRHRMIPGFMDLGIQTDGLMGYGGSGGPVFNRRNQLVGVMRAFRKQGPFSQFSGIGFAIPVEHIHQFLKPFGGIRFHEFKESQKDETPNKRLKFVIPFGSLSYDVGPLQTPRGTLVTVQISDDTTRGQTPN